MIQMDLKSMIFLEEKWVPDLFPPAAATTGLTVIYSGMLPKFPSVYCLERVKLMVM